MDPNIEMVQELSNCTHCNNSLCWSEAGYQDYLYFTKVIVEFLIDLIYCKLTLNP